jgi:putative transposase
MPVSTLEDFINSNPPARDLKRALAVQMSQQGYTYREIRDVLQVSVGFVSHCNQRDAQLGVAGLKATNILRGLRLLKQRIFCP